MHTITPRWCRLRRPTGDNLGAAGRRARAAPARGPPAWPAEQVTDRSERFLAAEALRGQLMLGLSDELPYGIAVEIERFEDLPDGRTEIDAVIWVERVGQRKIVIGAGGARLKAIGTRGAPSRSTNCSAGACTWRPGCACARAGPTTTGC